MNAPHTLPEFATFGAMLHYLRRRARLTQRELAIAVGYSESMISRLEHDERPPDVATLQALFAPALLVEDEPAMVARLVALAEAARCRGKDGSPAVAHQAGEPRLAGSFEHFDPDGHRLPYRLTSFVGRAEEIAEVTRLLASTRLVTLTGPGGCGKTSLAVETARAIAASGLPGGLHCDAGIYLVDLLALSDATFLAQTILSALGAEGNPARPAAATLVSFLGAKAVLLVLDNCEHLVDAVARLVTVLLESCGNLRVLATSRERLNIPGEVLFVVPALPFPNLQVPLDPASAQEFAAIRLFVDRGQAIAPAFALTAASTPDVARICALLDGLPLAIELAAAALATFTPKEILARLDAHFLLSSPGYRTADPRHRTLNDTVAWSYNLLPEAEQRLLMCLAVFAGGWSNDALEAICQEESGCLAHLRQLVQKSLVRVEQGRPGDDRTRYHLLRAVRDYAAVRLAEDSVADAIRHRHFVYFANLGIASGCEVFGPRHQAAMARLDAEYHNIRAAVQYAADKPELDDMRLHLASELAYYLNLRSYSHRAEAIAWLNTGTADDHLVSPSTRALAHAARLDLGGADLFHGGLILYFQDHTPGTPDGRENLVAACLAQGEMRAAGRLLLSTSVNRGQMSVLPDTAQDAQRALAAFEAAGDARGVALARSLLIADYLVRNDLEAAQALQEENLHFLRTYGVSWGRCEAHRIQARICFLRQDIDGMFQSMKALAALAEEEEYPNFLHHAFYVMEGRNAGETMRLAEALLVRQRQQGPSPMLGLALHQLGRMYLNARQYERAQSLLDEAIALWRYLQASEGPGTGLQWSLIDRGQVARCQGDGELAIRCFSESIALFAASTLPVGGGFSLLFRGMERLWRNEPDLAWEDFREALRVVTSTGAGWEKLLVMPLAGLGEVYRRRGELMQAGCFMAAAAVNDLRSGEPSSSGRYHEFADFQRVMAPVPTYRTDAHFEAGWQEGEQLSLRQAVAAALNE